tara:strand:+ start:182 stop:343 length:162 start_codon:yes stop_codon:yes gene_type:complete
MPPLEFPRTFDSWYDCSKGAHRESVLLMNKMGYKYINENKIAIKYACIEGHTT